MVNQQGICLEWQTAKDKPLEEKKSWQFFFHATILLVKRPSINIYERMYV